MFFSIQNHYLQVRIKYGVRDLGMTKQQLNLAQSLCFDAKQKTMEYTKHYVKNAFSLMHQIYQIESVQQCC